MLFPPKNCYRASSYIFSIICFFASGMVLVLAYVSGVFQNHILDSVPIVVVSIIFCVGGFLKWNEAYRFRKACYTIKTYGKRYRGSVKKLHYRKAMVDQKASDTYCFLVSYFNMDENLQKEFWTPIVDFCPFDTQRIECIVYEYNGEAYAEDFKGWERKGDNNKTSELSSWLPIIIVFTLLIILFFTMNK